MTLVRVLATLVAYVGMCLWMFGGFAAVMGALGWAGCRLLRIPVSGPVFRDPSVPAPPALSMRMLARLLRPGLIAVAVGLPLYGIGYAVAF